MLRYLFKLAGIVDTPDRDKGFSLKIVDSNQKQNVMEAKHVKLKNDLHEMGVQYYRMHAPTNAPLCRFVILDGGVLDCAQMLLNGETVKVQFIYSRNFIEVDTQNAIRVTPDRDVIFKSHMLTLSLDS